MLDGACPISTASATRNMDEFIKNLSIEFIEFY
jgi:hypothetical protein